MSRKTEGLIITLDDVWAEVGDKALPPYDVDGGFPASMSVPATHAFILSNTITATVGDFSALLATGFGKATINGVTSEFNVDFTGVSTFDQVAGALQGAMIAAAPTLIVTVKYLSDVNKFKIESATTGESSTVDFFIVPSTGVDISVLLRTSAAEGAVLNQGLGDFPRRTTFNFAYNQLYALGFDVNRYGANLAWDEVVSYEISAVVIGSDDNRYLSLVTGNIANDPVVGDAVTSIISAGVNFQAIDIQPGGDIIVVTGTGSVFKSTDNGVNFSLINSETFTTNDGIGEFTIVFNDTIVVQDLTSGLIKISSNEGTSYANSGVFFNFPQLDTVNFIGFRLYGARAGDGQQAGNNPTYQVVGLTVIGSLIYVVLFDLITPKARIINTTLDVNNIDEDGLDSMGVFLDGDDLYIAFDTDGGFEFSIAKYDITDTAIESVDIEVFSSIPTPEVFTGFGDGRGLIIIKEDTAGNKWLFASGRDVNNSQVSGYLRVDITSLTQANWTLDILTVSNSNLPSVLNNASNTDTLPQSYFANDIFLYFTVQVIGSSFTPDVAFIRTDINSKDGLDYAWEYYNAEQNNFNDNDGRAFFVKSDNSEILVLNGGANNPNQVTDPREFLSILGVSSQAWNALDSTETTIESTTNSLTVNEDNILNRVDINIAPSLLAKLSQLGNLDATLTLALTADIVISEIVSKSDPLQKIDLIYDFTNNQLKVTNTGANDIQLWYQVDATVDAINNPFIRTFGANTDKQTITPASTGFMTDDGLVDIDLSLLAINDRQEIKGHIIFDNGDITRFEFVEIIKLTTSTIKLAGGFINE